MLFFYQVVLEKLGWSDGGTETEDVILKEKTGTGMLGEEAEVIFESGLGQCSAENMCAG